MTVKQRQEFRIRLQKRARRAAERKLESFVEERNARTVRNFNTTMCYLNYRRLYDPEDHSALSVFHPRLKTYMFHKLYPLRQFTSAPGLPSRSITGTVSCELIGLLFLVFPYFFVFGAVR